MQLNRPWRGVLMLAVLILIAAHAIQPAAVPDRGTLIIRTFNGGGPVGGVWVTVTQVSGDYFEPDLRAKTDAAGRLFVARLPGTYSVDSPRKIGGAALAGVSSRAEVPVPIRLHGN
jgi:hypothetical protein